MGQLDEIASEQFSRWERRGRGWKVWPHPVPPEPAFLPFLGFHLPQPNPDVPDDGRRPGLLASAFDAIHKMLNPNPPMLPADPEPAEPEPVLFERGPLVELQALLPAKLNIEHEEFAAFLDQLAVCTEPVAFELLGTSDRIVAQFAAHPRDTPVLLRQLKAYFPDVAFIQAGETMATAWLNTEGEAAIVEFGLEREFMFPLATETRLDPFVALIGAMSELQACDLALFQVLFQPVQNDWPTNAWNIVADIQGNPRFVNRPELTEQAKEKLASPLYGTVVRVATKGADFERAWMLARELAFALRVFATPAGNALIPLHNDDYPFEAHEEDVVLRQSRRSGMLLNAEELIGLVHFPSPAVRSPKLQRQVQRTKAAPAIATGNHAFVLGENRHMGRTLTVSLTAEQRVRHMHVVGASGTGKSNLLFNLICHDIENGEGVGVLDPHGDLVEKILGIIPTNRIGDVVLVDPSDEECSVGFNILSAHSDFEKNLLASDLVSVFQRLSSSWGDQMGSVLQNAIHAFLESHRVGTLADLRRFLIDPAFRRDFLKTVSDPDVVFYWEKAFVQLTGNKSIGPVLTRLETFLAPKPIRYMVSQPVNRLDFAQILDTGKIFLAKLPQGQMGKENAFLLGSLLMAKFQQLAMSRQRLDAGRRRDFWLYVDEFHHFITPSMAEILTGARKYRIGLVLAHQELPQLHRNSEVASAVMSNPFTRVVFRVGDADARALESGFSYFSARDLQNLGTGEAVCRVERSEFDFNLHVPLRSEPDPATAAETRRQVVTASREKYATPRAQIEAALAQTRTSTPTEETPRSTGSGKEKRVDTSVEGNPSASVAEAPKPDVSVADVPQPVPDIPKPVLSEPLPVPVAREPSPPRDLGRGGAQHKSIQERLQAEAHTFGFLAEVERQLEERSMQAADLVLRKGDLSIAVEIAVTTTTDHEFGNVKKCLAAGFKRVAVVSPRPERLTEIQAAVVAGLGAEAASRVSFYAPDDFIAELRKLAASQLTESKPETPAERTTRGYKVRGSAPTLTAEERRAKEEIALRIMSEAMKRKP